MPLLRALRVNATWPGSTKGNPRFVEPRRFNSGSKPFQFRVHTELKVAASGRSRHDRAMSGKAPLLLATLFFSIGAAGLALTSAERASWGPFEPRGPQADQRVVIVDLGPSNLEPPELAQLLIPPPVELSAAEPELIVAAQPTLPPEPTPTPVPPLRVFGISSDSGGVSAAAATETPPPLRIMNVASDDESTETPEAEATATETPTAEVEATATSATGEAEATATPTN